jgi:DNA-binding transcriptional regulator YiaG
MRYPPHINVPAAFKAIVEAREAQEEAEEEVQAEVEAEAKKAARQAKESARNAPKVVTVAADSVEAARTYLHVEPLQLSVYIDDPVFNVYGAAEYLGVTDDCLKKWRQRSKGPDYIQYYGHGGEVRYELSALKTFREEHKVHPKRKI